MINIWKFEMFFNNYFQETYMIFYLDNIKKYNIFRMNNKI